jgi:inhibitor of KinA sporulation pathway (predicted exonuclease)
MVLGNLTTLEYYYNSDRKDFLIKTDSPIHPEITSLTGITDEMINKKGRSLQEAYDELKFLFGLEHVIKNLVVWGGNDSAYLREQLNYPEDWPFGDRVIDVKTIYVYERLVRGKNYIGGLKKALENSGDKFYGTQHRAYDDAWNTLRLLFLLMKRRRKTINFVEELSKEIK